MIKQFYTSVRAAFKGVPLPLIHIHHPASPPICRHHTAPHYFIADICHPPHPRLPRRSPPLLANSLPPPPPPPPPPFLTFPPLHLMAPPLCHSLPCLLLALPHTLILIFHPPMLLPYSLHRSYQYYLCSNQILHSAVAHNILSTFALSLLPPLQFSHLPPSHIHSQKCLWSTQPFA